MKIALLGYGKMGKEIEKIALERGHHISLKINRENREQVTPELLKSVDLAIEFSSPDSAIANIKMCFDADLPVVVGTTGWYQQLEEVKTNCITSGKSLFFASNFSLGVALFSKVNNYLAAIMNHYPEYEVSMKEIHHIHKTDKPSGTAITLANQIIHQINRKTDWSLTDTKATTIQIEDLREGEVPGTHIIKYSSSIDDIEIMHKAHNRKGFAHGAVLAAEFLSGKKGFYTMDDLVN